LKWNALSPIGVRRYVPPVNPDSELDEENFYVIWVDEDGLFRYYGVPNMKEAKKLHDNFKSKISSGEVFNKLDIITKSELSRYEHDIEHTKNKEENNKNKIFSKMNAVNHKLNPAIDSVLQDIAQMYGIIDYKDIMTLRPNPRMNKVILSFYEYLTDNEPSKKELKNSKEYKDFMKLFKTKTFSIKSNKSVEKVSQFAINSTKLPKKYMYDPRIVAAFHNLREFYKTHPKRVMPADPEYDELRGLKLKLNKLVDDFNARSKKFSNNEITTEEEFREYAHNVMKNAHGDNYSEEVTNKVVDDLIKDNPDADYGELIGRLTSGLGD